MAAGGPNWHGGQKAHLITAAELEALLYGEELAPVWSNIFCDDTILRSLDPLRSKILVVSVVAPRYKYTSAGVRNVSVFWDRGFDQGSCQGLAEGYPLEISDARPVTPRPTLIRTLSEKLR